MSTEQMARVPLRRSYEVRAAMLLAFNTSKQRGADHDDALEAAYQAMLKVSDGQQPAASNPGEPGFREDQVSHLALVERLTAENQRLWAVYHDQQDKRLAAEQKCDALSEQLAVANSLLNRVHGVGALSAEDHDAIGNYFVECSSADEPGGTVDRLQELLKRKQAEVVEEATKAIDAWREVTALRAQLAERNEVIPEACAECGATSTTGRKLFLYCGHCVGCLLTEVPSQPSPIEPDKKELVICTQDQSNPQTNTSQHAHCPHCAVCHTADEPCIDALRRVLALYEKRVLVPTGYCIMPTSLTAENGARALLAGEFSFCQQHVCHECSLCSDESSDGCEICGGEGSYNQHSPVEWTLLKEIYQKAVAGLSLKPAP